jgi:hypothetical protein
MLGIFIKRDDRDDEFGIQVAIEAIVVMVAIACEVSNA